MSRGLQGRRRVEDSVSAEEPTGISTLSMRDMALLSRAETRRAHGKGWALPVRGATSRASNDREPGYGRETGVASPVAALLKGPVAVEAVNAYGELQPAGGGGTFAMNGPAVCPKVFVAIPVSWESAVGNTPMWAA